MINQVLERLEAIVDASGIARNIEAHLAVGVRERQLSVRTMLVGILLILFDNRPAHLSRVHAALVGLPTSQQRRLGVIAQWKNGPHTVAYRQVEYTMGLVCEALGKDQPDGTPSKVLSSVLDALIESSVAPPYKEMSNALAVDWTDVESFSTRRTKPNGSYADQEATWGHRKGGGPGEKDEMFFGYYLSLATMIAADAARAAPELVRRMVLTSCRYDPVPAFVPVLKRLVSSGVALGDVVCDSGYSHRIPEHFALPVRALGANLVMDLYPNDRGTQGTFEGAICFNGNLYCPATPAALFELAPIARGASAQEVAAHDEMTAELSRHKLGRISADDADGYHRVGCPAVMGKLRCPLRPDSMALSFSHPEVSSPPEHPEACCTQQTITVPPSVNAKTRQRHDYPSKAHRHSYARRSAVERSNSRIKDPASVDIARGWCRLMGLAPMSLLLACALVVRNLGVADAFEERQAENERRRAAGLEPKTRRRRRKGLSELANATHAPP